MATERNRSARKGALTREANNLDVLIEERDKTDLENKKAALKQKFKAFTSTHDLYHASIDTDNAAAIDTSQKYFDNVKSNYIGWLKQINAVLDTLKDDAAGATETASVARTVSQIVNLPSLELQSFSGKDDEDLYTFLAVFDEIITPVTPSASTKLIRLKSHCDGVARKAIQACNPRDGDDAYDRARAILIQQFGSKHKICKTTITRLIDGPPVNTPSDLQTLAYELAAAEDTLKGIDMYGEMDTNMNIVKMVHRLVPRLRYKWRDLVMKEKEEKDKYLKFSDFVKFVQRQASIVNDPIYGQDELSRSQKPQSTSSKGAKGDVKGGVKSYGATHDSSTHSSRDRKCVLCDNNHKLFYCKQFRDKNVNDRITFVKAKQLCENCLYPGHSVVDCKMPYICKIDGCNKKHSKLLHVTVSGIDNTDTSYHVNVSSKPGNNAGQSTVPSGNVDQGNYLISHNSNDNADVYMPIVAITVNEKYHAHALLDTGSSGSFCSRRLADKLQLSGEDIQYTLQTLHGSAERCSKRVKLNLHAEDTSENLIMHNVMVVNDIPVNGNTSNLPSYPHLADLHFPSVGEVDIIIGQDNPTALIPLEVRSGDGKAPFAVRTKLGWCLNGCIGSMVPGQKVTSNFISCKQKPLSISERVDRLWELQEAGLHDKHQDIDVSQEDCKVLDLWDRESEIVDDHVQLPIPWKNPDTSMPNNIHVAKLRLEMLYKSLKKKNMVDKYDQAIQNMVTQGYAEAVEEHLVESPRKIWYLPTHCVPKKDGNIRIVFDCAHQYNGISLNNSCMQGPKLTNPLFDVLLRFRQYQHVFTADISSMYNQVIIPPEDRDALRFLWKRDNKLLFYRSTRHIFGGIWCSSSASYALRKSAEITDDVSVQWAIRNAFYVDDIAFSHPEEQSLNYVAQNVKATLSKRGFRLTKFVTNSTLTLSQLEAEDILTLPQASNGEAIQSVLGSNWSMTSDILFVPSPLQAATTKSQMLSSLASIYDPLGLVAPFVVAGKLIFQSTTHLASNWHQALPKAICDQWHQWVLSMTNLRDIHISRCLVPSPFTDAKCELHCFNDASQSAYGCVVYIRCLNKMGDIYTCLVASKSRLCPLKSQTIPRLELQSCVLSATLECSVRSALSIQLLDTTFWTDSMIALAYIHNESKRFNIFVSNRVQKIKQHSLPCNWKHIPGSENPADLLTRPVTMSNFKQELWKYGPPFLATHRSRWPRVQSVDHSSLNESPEIIKSKRIVLATGVSHHPLDVLLEHFSEWDKLKRALAWWMKLISNLRSKNTHTSDKHLEVEDVKSAEVRIIKHVQQKHYKDDLKRLQLGQLVKKNSHLRKLNPQLDNTGLLVVGGRLAYSALTHRQKHPIIIPHKSQLAVLIVRDIHQRCHLGREWIFSLLRRSFWITKARNVIYRVTADCITCKKLFASPQPQIMADLPTDRLSLSQKPFSHTGIDVFGPYVVQRNRHQLKRYGCIFVCFNTRGVHLEVLDNLESDTFINAFRRFAARRGMPTSAFTDNATNFVGAQAELSRCINHVDKAALKAYGINAGVDWKFNIPHASHMAGVYERMIRTVRKVLVGMLIEQQRLTDDMLTTLFCEAEAIVNSRPLTKLSMDINDDLPLTPSHFLSTAALPNISPGNFTSADGFRRKWKHIQYLTDMFWRRYIRSYMTELQRRQKWHQARPNLKEGDLVLIVGENVPRRLWPLGIIKAVNTGRDGLVRSCRVKTRATEFVRPITKLVSLEI